MPPEPEEIRPAEGEVSLEPEAEPAAADQAATELLDQLQRLQAEFSNYRKRVQKEKSEWDARSKADLLALLLPVLDDLERARSAWGERGAAEDAEGLFLILDRLEAIARAVGLEKQATEPGTPFDPHEHEALMTTPSDEHAEGTIIDTLQPGYVYRGILLRPARVSVSQGPAGGRG